MSEKIRYTDEPLGDLEVVPDFLPRPEDLVFRDEGVKLTIALSKRSVEFFKSEAQRHNTQYQRMIRRLLDAYAEHHSPRSLTAFSTDARKIGARRLTRTFGGTKTAPGWLLSTLNSHSRPCFLQQFV